MIELVVILGAGESGTGAAVLAKVKGYDVFVSDQGIIKEKYKTILKEHGIEFEEGKHTEEKILKASIVIKSPGIPDKVEVIEKIRAKKIVVLDEIEFAWRFLKGKVIAVTGTNGKTTTTLLTYHLMKSSGFNVALAGNVGESLALKVSREEYDWYVIEMSSFQLDGTIKFMPYIGIMLNITPDHLDRYQYELSNYVQSKMKLISNMKKDNYFVYYAEDPILRKTLEGVKLAPASYPIYLNQRGTSSVFFDGDKMSFSFGRDSFKISQSDTTLKGPHNLINTMAAVTAVYLAGASFSSIKEGLKTFKNAPHRLESIAKIKGVEFVNDSKATNVDSVVYGLGSYEGPLIWIAGGIDKGNDYELIASDVKKKVRVLICLGKDNEKLKQAFGGVVEEIYETQDMKELVKLAWKVSKKGDVVLLSPACASFDLFKNYEDRGNQFRQAVLELKNELKGKA